MVMVQAKAQWGWRTGANSWIHSGVRPQSNSIKDQSIIINPHIC